MGCFFNEKGDMSYMPKLDNDLNIDSSRDSQTEKH